MSGVWRTTSNANRTNGETSMSRDARITILETFLLTFLLSFCVTGQARPAFAQKSAKKDVAITSSEKCNEPNPPGRIKYLENRNDSRSVVVKLRVLRTPSEGQSESESQLITVPAKGKVELGCDREGAGAPVIVDVIWSVESARYKP
jgi:hypothetical protein